MQNGRARLLQWLERSKLDQVQAARLIGIHPSHLNHFVTGDRRPGLDTAVKIERVTGIVVEAWASTDEDEMAAAIPITPTKRRVAK